MIAISLTGAVIHRSCALTLDPGELQLHAAEECHDAVPNPNTGCTPPGGRRMSAEAPPTPGGSVADALEGLPLAALSIDANGEVNAVNKRWHTLTGLDEDRSLGAGWLDAVHPEVVESLLERVLGSHRTGTTGRSDFRLANGGRFLWSRWWWQPNQAGVLVCVNDIDDDRAREAELLKRATHDSLTGLVDRTEFLTLVERALHRAQRSGSPPGVVFVDLDGFAQVNERFGHGVGDEVLRSVAERLGTAVRPTDVAARVGGDEFAVLCEHLDGPDATEVGTIATRIRQAVRASNRSDDHPFALEASAGVAMATPDDTAVSLLARADRAMFAAKRASIPRLLASTPPLTATPRTLAGGSTRDERIGDGARGVPVTIHTTIEVAGDLVRHVHTVGAGARHRRAPRGGRGR